MGRRLDLNWTIIRACWLARIIFCESESGADKGCVSGVSGDQVVEGFIIDKLMGRSRDDEARQLDQDVTVAPLESEMSAVNVV